MNALERVNNNRERLGTGGLLLADTYRNMKKPFGIGDKILGKRAQASQTCNYLTTALLVMSIAAIGANSAGIARHGGDNKVADLPAADVFPNFNDISAEFMPHYERERHFLGPFVVMDVTATNARSPDLEHNAVIRTDRARDINNLKVRLSGILFYECFHCFCLLHIYFFLCLTLRW